MKMSFKEKIGGRAALKALQKGDLEIFKSEITPLLRKYRKAIYGGVFTRGFRKLKRMIAGA